MRTQILFQSRSRVKKYFRDIAKRCLCTETTGFENLEARREGIRSNYLMTAPMNINLISETVAFKNIDKKGGSKRFYREVFVDQTENGDFTLFLDHRQLLLKANKPLTIPNYHVALVVASEWEMQSEFIRLESMPITNFEVKRSVMEVSDVTERRRRGIIQTLEHTIPEDLLCLAESQELREEGFYERHWQPIIDWFNERFDTDLKITYADMQDDDREQSFFEELVGKDPQQVLSEFEDFMKKIKTDAGTKEKYKSILQPGMGMELGKFRRYIRSQSDLSLTVMDEMLGYFPSPILTTAIVEHAFDLEFLFEAINCPELDTQMISTYKENLKLTESRLFMSAAKCYLNLYQIEKDSRVQQKTTLDPGKNYRDEYFGPFAKMTHQIERNI